MIVGFLGRKRSGKDTAVNYLIDNYNFTRYAFGDPVKDVCRTMFNFSEEIYGKELTVDFLTFIRSEQKFNNFEELTKQINKDINKAKEYHQL